MSLLKANIYFLQHHFKKVYTRNCSFIYKKVKMKGGLGWMKKFELTRFLMGIIGIYIYQHYPARAALAGLLGG